MRRNFLSQRHQDTEGFSGNGADGASPSKMGLGASALGRYGRFGKIMDGKIIF
jgi:hypothetical protein